MALQGFWVLLAVCLYFFLLFYAFQGFLVFRFFGFGDRHRVIKTLFACFFLSVFNLILIAFLLPSHSFADFLPYADNALVSLFFLFLELVVGALISVVPAGVLALFVKVHQVSFRTGFLSNLVFIDFQGFWLDLVEKAFIVIAAFLLFALLLLKAFGRSLLPF